MAGLRLDSYNNILAESVKLERGYAKRAGTLSSALLALAGSCETAGAFIDKMNEAEAWVRTAEAGDVRLAEGIKMPRAWVQAKSDIVAGLKLGLNPVDFDSLSAFKRAKVKRNEQATTAAQVGAREQDAQPTDSTEAIAALGTKGTEASVPHDLIPVVKYLSVLPELSRKRTVHDMTVLAKTAHDNHLNGLEEGRRRQQATG